MELREEKKTLRHLRFSKGTVAVSAALGLAGLFILLRATWQYSLLAGVVLLGAGIGTFLTAGYYWGCDNESCS